VVELFLNYPLQLIHTPDESQVAHLYGQTVQTVPTRKVYPSLHSHLFVAGFKYLLESSKQDKHVEASRQVLQ
jgi:hypothetical protein